MSVTNMSVTQKPVPIETKRTVFIKDLALQAEIGAYKHERGRKQPVIINIQMDVHIPDDPSSNTLDNIVCYDAITRSIEALLDEGHIELVEMLADRVARLILEQPLVNSTTIRIEKPMAVKKAETVGVEITRERSN